VGVQHGGLEVAHKIAGLVGASRGCVGKMILIWLVPAFDAMTCDSKSAVSVSISALMYVCESCGYSPTRYEIRGLVLTGGRLGGPSIPAAMVKPSEVAHRENVPGLPVERVT
jgi:hypothetical protein